MLYPITSTDAINWLVDTQTLSNYGTSPFVSSAHHPYQSTCWDTLFKVKDRLLTGGKVIGAVLK